MTTFMVIATIREGTDMRELGALVPEEIEQVERLREEGRMGAVHIAFARRVIFIEAYGADEAAAVDAVMSLPMAPFFDLDVYPTAPPGVPGGAPSAEAGS